MKFYSEVTKKLYNTEDELTAAENKVKIAEEQKLQAEKAKKEARATRAKEVEKALKEANEAQTKANKLLKNFVKDYGQFHMSYTNENNDIEKIDTSNFFSILDAFFK